MRWQTKRKWKRLTHGPPSYQLNQKYIVLWKKYKAHSILPMSVCASITFTCFIDIHEEQVQYRHHHRQFLSSFFLFVLLPNILDLSRKKLDGNTYAEDIHTTPHQTHIKKHCNKKVFRTTQSTWQKDILLVTLLVWFFSSAVMASKT